MSKGAKRVLRGHRPASTGGSAVRDQIEEWGGLPEEPGRIPLRWQLLYSARDANIAHCRAYVAATAARRLTPALTEALENANRELDSAMRQARGAWAGRNMPEVFLSFDQVAVRVRRRAAKAMAKRIGLRYWPALLEKTVSPGAFLAAERVLSRKHGHWSGNRDGNHGGWDSEGHYGLSARCVANMWFAAGCRDTPKFRWQVRNRMIAKKGDSLPWLRQFAKGFRWLKRRFGYDATRFSRKATAAIGRLSPLARSAAVFEFNFDFPATVIRIRHLNWDLVQRVTAPGAPRRLIAAVLPDKAGQAFLGLREPGDWTPFADRGPHVQILHPDATSWRKACARIVAPSPDEVAGWPEVHQ